MQMPVDITYRGVEKSDALETLIRSKMEKLEEVCDHIIGCHIAVEKAHEHPSHGSPYRVRLDITVPPNHEIVADRNPGEGVQYASLESVIRDAFEAARRQLRDLNQQQEGRRKQHTEQAIAGIVTKLFPSQNYGFIKTLDGREIYFHRNSVLHDDYDRLSVGAGVQFFPSEGENGPQASTIRLVDKPGIRPADNRGDSAESEAPQGWEYVQS
ncbi:HPF/RaiA family ribosome-associated protein [Oscillatoria sp. CS-180]|uniref:HPF/RaiA family ribosome-associated protein n=1 Tax=Oscillatoria sp. CS-180 TaxID=3021720 RepID=UPI00232C4B16|nr:HPF/RaiA family ribosome-associated protein [Oscillatoria sp. CS-180]MDB9524729.1 HPF/RaiA family ribosome-associated protein [Oscillatoria sp. CS-180]